MTTSPNEHPAITRLFKTADFAKAAKKEGVEDSELLKAAEELLAGKGDKLAKGVWKKRLNRNLDRSIVLLRIGTILLYQYLFAKNDRANISKNELKGYRALANALDNLDGAMIEELVRNGRIIELQEKIIEQQIQERSVGSDP